MRFLGKFLVGAFLGGIFGALVGLLIAPDSGLKLREQVGGTFIRIRDEVTQAADSKRSELQEQLIRLRQPPQSAE